MNDCKNCRLLTQKLADLAEAHMQNLENHGNACREDEHRKLTKNISLLRQWLNEKPTDMLVTNEDIRTFLDIA